MARPARPRGTGGWRVLGWDLTAGPARPTACALLEGRRLLALWQEWEDEALLASAERLRPDRVAMDAPLGLPRGLCCLEPACPCQPAVPQTGRACERALAREGIGSFFTTKRSLIKGLVYRALRLRRALEGMGVAVLEVFPYATRVRLWGRPLPPKASPKGLRLVREGLQALGLDLGPWRDAPLTHDEADALLSAFTGLLWLEGQAEAVGREDEGRIVVPVPGRAAPAGKRPRPPFRGGQGHGL